MKTLTLIRVVSLSLMSLWGATSEVKAAGNEGSVQITVIDVDGSVMTAPVPVYINGQGKTKFMGGKEIPGSAVLTLKEGTYKLSAAITRNVDGYLDRFSSNAADVRVVAGDNVSVILTLKPLESRFAALSYSEVNIAGL
jgi:hypothetical protein